MEEGRHHRRRGRRLDHGEEEDQRRKAARTMTTASRIGARVSSALIGSILGALLSAVLPASRAAASFMTFESGQVRPLARTPDGHTLLALDTPDARLEVFAIADGDLTHVASVPVGLEPVAVA